MQHYQKQDLLLSMSYWNKHILTLEKHSKSFIS